MATHKDRVFRKQVRQPPRQWRHEGQSVKLGGLRYPGTLGILNLASMASFPDARDNLRDYFHKAGADAERSHFATKELTDGPRVPSPRQIEAVEDDAN